MKKNFKFYFLFIFMLLAIGTTNVYAVSNLTITSKSYIRTNFSDGTHRTESQFGTNKGTAYCITPHKIGGDKGTSLTYNSTVNSGPVLYLLNNSNSDYLTTQLAIWAVNDNYIPAAYNKNKTLVNKVNALAKKAKSNANYSTTNPSLKLSSSTLSFSESNDGNYYVSNTITVTSNINVTATVSGDGAKIIADGKSSNSLTLANNTKFYVRIAKSNVTSNTNIKVTVKGTKNKVAYQRYSGGKWQDLIVLVKTPKTVSTTISGTVKPVTHKCEYTNGKYYDKDGKITDKTTYSLQCEKHTCEKVGDTYFGKDGKVTTEEGYNQQCKAKTYTCEKVGDTYYGKDGKVTTEDGYNLQCKTHTCEKVGDTYFDKDGKITTESNYNLQCKTHSCEIIDDKFFDKNGNQVTEDEYNLQCKTHTCEIVGNKYFDYNGNETDEATYKSQCETVIEVPNTGSSDNLVFTVLGIVTVTGVVLMIKKF